MRKLLGYACHRASVALHDVAVRLLCGPPADDPWGRDDESDFDHLPPKVTTERWDPWTDGVPVDITLHDVAPRLAATIDWALSHITRRNQ
jgi:hypothetical protein